MSGGWGQRLSECVKNRKGLRVHVGELGEGEVANCRTRLVPVFMIPTEQNAEDDEGPAETAADPKFCTMRHVVGRAGIEPALATMHGHCVRISPPPREEPRTCRPADKGAMERSLMSVALI